MRFKTEAMEARLRAALADAFDTLETDQGLTVQKTVNAAMDFTKGELVIVPYTANIQFATKGSIKAQAMHRDSAAFAHCSSADCTLDGHEVECFLKAPAMFTQGDVQSRVEPDSAWEKVPFPIPFWLVSRGQQTLQSDETNLVRAVHKHAGFHIPVLKNNVPLKTGDVLQVASNKRGREMTVGDAVAQDTEAFVAEGGIGDTAPARGRGRGEKRFGGKRGRGRG
jgi:hypothetical protein